MILLVISILSGDNVLTITPPLVDYLLSSLVDYA